MPLFGGASDKERKQSDLDLLLSVQTEKPATPSRASARSRPAVRPMVQPGGRAAPGPAGAGDDQEMDRVVTIIGSGVKLGASSSVRQLPAGKLYEALSGPMSAKPRPLGIMKYVKAVLVLDPVPAQYKEELKALLSGQKTGNTWLRGLSNPKFKEITTHAGDQLRRIANDLQGYYSGILETPGGADLSELIGPAADHAISRQDDWRVGMPSPPTLSSAAKTSAERVFKHYIVDFYLIVAKHMAVEFKKEMIAIMG